MHALHRYCHKSVVLISPTTSILSLDGIIIGRPPSAMPVDLAPSDIVRLLPAAAKSSVLSSIVDEATTSEQRELPSDLHYLNLFQIQFIICAKRIHTASLGNEQPERCAEGDHGEIARYGGARSARRGHDGHDGPDT